MLQSMKVEYIHVIMPIAILRSLLPYLWIESRGQIERENAFKRGNVVF